MKRLQWLPVLLSLAAIGAGADPADLSGGVLIAHYVPEIPLTSSEEACELYSDYAITQFDQQVNRIDTPGGTPDVQQATWFIIAAWSEEKEFCAVQVGMGDYDAAIFAFTDCGPCCPPTGCLELPHACWPGPNSGTAWVATGDPWTGNFVPVYVINGYAYGDEGPGVIPLVPDPTPAAPFGGTGNCFLPPEKYDALLGGMGINMDGIYAGPASPSAVPDPVPGAVPSTSWGAIKAHYR